MNQARVSFSHPNLPNLMQSLSDGQIIPTPIEIVDFRNSINEINGTMLRNMQQVGGDDACFGFVPTMATKNTTATT